MTDHRETNANQRYLALVRRDCPLPQGALVDVYCRDSGGETQERSVAQQEAVALEYIAAHHLVLNQIYRDEALTGSNAEDRTELNRMLSDISASCRQIRDLVKRERHMAKHPRGLIVFKSNRLGRDSIETTLTKAELRVRGITIVELIPTVTTGDITVDAILEAVQMAQDEKLLKQISQDSKRGLAELVGMRDNDPEFRRYNPDWPTNDGRYLGLMPGMPPRGFQTTRVKIGVRERKRRGGTHEMRSAQRLEPDPAQWPQARKAWDMKLARATLDDIQRETRLYKSAGGFNSFFTNRIYTGVLEYGGREYRDFVPAMVTQAEFDAVQQIIQASAEKRHGNPAGDAEPRRRASRHLLSGLIFCGHHHGDEPMMSANVDGHGWDHYLCTQRSECGAKRVSAAAINAAVVDALTRSVLAPERLRTVAAKLAHARQEQSAVDARALAEIEAQIRDVRSSVEQLVDAVEQAGFSAALARRLAEREGELASLQTRAAGLRASQLTNKKAAAVSEDQVAEWARQLRTALDDGDTRQARDAMRQFVNRVVIRDGKAAIEFTLPSFGETTRNGIMTPRGLIPSPCIVVRRKLRHTWIG